MSRRRAPEAFLCLTTLFLSLAAGAAASDPAVSIGPGSGALEAERRGDPECGTLLMHSDGSYENGYAWQYGGSVPPYYGAFAECYAGPATICNLVIDVCRSEFQIDYPVDFFVWDDSNGAPANVRCVRTGVEMGPMAYWPALSRHRIAMSSCCVEGPFWPGFWGEWPGQITLFWIGADLDGPGGCPMTNIAPGLGWPSGWQSVDLVWGTTAALGIGVEVQPCLPVPNAPHSWGRVKALYR